MKLDTLIVKGIESKNNPNKAVVPPVFLASTFVQDDLENFQEFVENLEKSFIVEQTNSNTKIESNYLMIQSKDNLILHLGIRQGKIEDTIEDFSVFKKDSYMETFLVREDFNYFEKSKH